MMMRIKTLLKLIAFGSTFALYLQVIMAYIISYQTDFRFCILNNAYGEFWFELIALIFFGIFTALWLIWDIIQIDDKE